jgi:hypothetical protein
LGAFSGVEVAARFHGIMPGSRVPEMRRSFAHYWASACFVAVLTLGGAGHAEPFDPASTDWEGYAHFVALSRQILGDALLIVSTLDFSEIRSSDVLILVHPERTLDIRNLVRFMSAGGRVVLLDDFGTGKELLEHFGIARSSLPPHPAEQLRGKPELAIAVPVSDHELVRNVTRLVTNHATAVADSALTPLLEVRGQAGEAALVGAIGSVSRGGLVILGDPSALMNSMLIYPGNERLAENIALWASRPHAGEVPPKTFLARGSFISVGAFGGPSNDDTAARSRLGDGVPPHRSGIEGKAPRYASLGASGAHFVAALVGLAVVVWIGLRAGRTYRIVSPRLTRPIPLYAQGGGAGRAAALIARKSSRELALLEIGKALEEDLSLALGQQRPLSHDALVQRLERARFLSADTLQALRELLSRVAHIETLTSAGRGGALGRVRDTDVLAAAKVAREVSVAVRSSYRENTAA